MKEESKKCPIIKETSKKMKKRKEKVNEERKKGESMNELEVKHRCAHCGKPNPTYCIDSLYCCSECKKDLNYYIVFDDDYGQVVRNTRLLTKKSAEESLKRIFESASVLIHQNIRIITKEEYEKLKLLRKIFYLKKDIKLTEKRLKEDKEKLIKLQKTYTNG